MCALAAHSKHCCSLTIEMLKSIKQEENFPVPVGCGVFASGMTMEKQRGA